MSTLLQREHSNSAERGTAGAFEGTRYMSSADMDAIPSNIVDARDYARIERAIAFLDREAHRQPSLEELAAVAGLSAMHFQRLFSRWAGVSPKRFLQHRTLFTARALLQGRRSLLDASYEAGLSGPGRLHDLFVNLVAMTPAEFRDRGRGLDIAYGIHATPFGDCLLGETRLGICSLTFLAEGQTAEEAIHGLAAAWPAARLAEDRERTGETVTRVFAALAAGAGTDRPLSLLVRGTNFQVQVWEALLRIPAGDVVSYGELARQVGAESATRAVGTAVGRNPVAWLIPCHRVIRKTGAFGGYRWGEERKRVMLAWESVRAGEVARASHG